VGCFPDEGERAAETEKKETIEKWPQLVINCKNLQ
jgi:hypothetical protein